MCLIEWTTTLPFGMPSYKLAKFLLPFLMPLTQNDYTITDSFHLAEEICKQDPNLYMASPDVDSLFTNIPLREAIDICIASLYKDDEYTLKIPKDIFCNLLDDVAMGSPLGPTLDNIFKYSFENKWLKDCPHSVKPVFYKRYVDDIFVLLSFLDQAENERKLCCLSFLNINVFVKRENFSLMFIRKRPSTLILTGSYLKPIKPG